TLPPGDRPFSIPLPSQRVGKPRPLAGAVRQAPGVPRGRLRRFLEQAVQRPREGPGRPAGAGPAAGQANRCTPLGRDDRRLARGATPLEAGARQLEDPLRRSATVMTQTPQQAREQLDAQVREIVNWHFDPDKGTPFWLDKVKELGFDPRKE